eukprot:767990-Hanusia_phi.AAC.3
MPSKIASRNWAGNMSGQGLISRYSALTESQVGQDHTSSRSLKSSLSRRAGGPIPGSGSRHLKKCSFSHHSCRLPSSLFPPPRLPHPPPAKKKSPPAPARASPTLSEPSLPPLLVSTVSASMEGDEHVNRPTQTAALLACFSPSLPSSSRASRYPGNDGRCPEASGQAGAAAYLARRTDCVVASHEAIVPRRSTTRSGQRVIRTRSGSEQDEAASWSARTFQRIHTHPRYSLWRS